MNEPQFECRQLGVTYRASTGAYHVFICARERRDKRWDGFLEFRRIGDDERFATNVQTTQRSAEEVFRWGAALTDSHIEGSFASASAPRSPKPPAIAASATPARTVDRLAYLVPIERDILDLFRATGRTRIATSELFQLGPHANADYVRAFEDLEKQWRCIVRHTSDGTDWLELTAEGRALVTRSREQDVPRSARIQQRTGGSDRSG